MFWHKKDRLYLLKAVFFMYAVREYILFYCKIVPKYGHMSGFQDT